MTAVAGCRRSGTRNTITERRSWPTWSSWWRPRCAAARAHHRRPGVGVRTAGARDAGLAPESRGGGHQRPHRRRRPPAPRAVRRVAGARAHPGIAPGAATATGAWERRRPRARRLWRRARDVRPAGEPYRARCRPGGRGGPGSWNEADGWSGPRACAGRRADDARYQFALSHVTAGGDVELFGELDHVRDLVDRVLVDRLVGRERRRQAEVVVVAEDLATLEVGDPVRAFEDERDERPDPLHVAPVERVPFEVGRGASGPEREAGGSRPTRRDPPAGCAGPGSARARTSWGWARTLPRRCSRPRCRSTWAPHTCTSPRCTRAVPRRCRALRSCGRSSASSSGSRSPRCRGRTR